MNHRAVFGLIFILAGGPATAANDVRVAMGYAHVRELKCIQAASEGFAPELALEDESDFSLVELYDQQLEFKHHSFHAKKCPLDTVKKIWDQSRQRLGVVNEMPIRIQTVTTEPQMNQNGQCTYLLIEHVSFNLAHNVGDELRVSSQRMERRSSTACRAVKN